MGKGKDRRSKYWCRKFLNLSEAQFIILKFMVKEGRQVTLMELGEMLGKSYREVSKQYVSQEVKGCDLLETVRSEQLWVSLIPGVEEELGAVFSLLEVIKKKRDAWRNRR